MDSDSGGSIYAASTATGSAAPARPSAPAVPVRWALPGVLSAALIAIGFWGAPGLSVFDTYKALVFVHAGVALVALGSTFAMPIIQPLAGRGGVPTLRFTMRFNERLEQNLVMPGAILVIASGIALTFTDLTAYNKDLPGWLIAGYVWVAVVMIVAQFVQGPALRKAIAILDETPDASPPPPSLAPIAARLKLIGTFLSLSTIGVMFLMVWRPGF